MISKCPRCGVRIEDRLICDECYLDVRCLGKPMHRTQEETVVSKTHDDAVTMEILHLLLGTNTATDVNKVWRFKDFQMSLLIATMACTLWHQLEEKLGNQGVAICDWVRMRDADKTVELLAFNTRTAGGDETYNILLRDWAIKALVDWSNSSLTRSDYAPQFCKLCTSSLQTNGLCPDDGCAGSGVLQDMIQPPKRN